LHPVLAGRNQKALHTLAAQYKLEYIVADLENKDAVNQMLQGHSLVLNAAGPFSRTAKPIIESCLQNKVHYLDITGEIGVFEMAKTFDKQAIERGITILPGSGFDVVAKYCLALFLKNELPDALWLQLAFTSVGGGLSHGTATTMAEGLGAGGAARVNGKIIPQPLGKKGMWVDFGDKKRFVMSIPWGDVSTAYFTTGIPNIETYTGIDPRIYKVLKVQALFNWLLRKRWVQNFIKTKIDKQPAGPTPEQRQKSKSLVWGHVKNSNGGSKTALITCPDGYTLTAHSSLLISQKILSGNFKPGYQTPASAYGADFILEVPDSKREVL
jgi:short subunit dehydrogenase-like uncharacterized protein